jgi:hypothetical protein
MELLALVRQLTASHFTVCLPVPTKIRYTRCDFLTAVLLRIQVFWDATLSLETTHPKTQLYIPEYLNPQQ